jgi:hypothetical protein
LQGFGNLHLKNRLHNSFSWDFTVQPAMPIINVVDPMGDIQEQFEVETTFPLKKNPCFAIIFSLSIGNVGLNI